MRSKLLSICIPTYNGGLLLKNNIDIIIKQIYENKMQHLVEIIVSDNCSTDDTNILMSSYLSKYSDFIKYNRNITNLGYDKNVIKCCEIASGLYIHLFGDDDFYAPLGLSRLCNVLLNNTKLSVLVLSNYYLRDDYYGLIVSRKGLNDFYYFEDRYYSNDSSKFIIDLEDRAWPNTNIVFRKKYFEQIPNIEKFFYKDWIHIYILLYIAFRWPESYMFADKYPIVINRVGVQKWLNNVDGPRIYYNNLWVYSFTNTIGYHTEVFDWYKKKLLSEFIKNIKFRRSYHFYINLGYILKYFKFYKNIPNFYIKFLPLFLNPLRSLVSLRYEKYNTKKIKYLTVLGFKIKIKESKIDMVNNQNDIDRSIAKIFCSQKGNIKQLVLSKHYEHLCKLLEPFVYYNKCSLHLYKRLARTKKHKYIPYSRYIVDYSAVQDFIKILKQ